MTEHINVLYLLAYPRSGTTILGNILDEVTGFFHIGELHYLWEENLLRKSRRCGCGCLVEDCDLWSSILGFIAVDRSTARRAVVLQRSLVRTTNLSTLLKLTPAVARRDPDLREYLGLLAEVYRAASRVSGSTVIIDSSKWPADALVAGLLEPEGISVTPIHVIRDSRKVVFSRQRRNWSPQSGREYLRARRALVAYDALGWAGLNVLAEVVCRRRNGLAMRLRYEDFVNAPRDSVEKIVGTMDKETPKLPFVAEDTVHLGVNHTLGGNRNRRVDRGDIRIAEDGLWQKGLHPIDKALTTTLTLPILLLFGYLPRARGASPEWEARHGRTSRQE
jgi:hypothetical protein